MSVSVVFLANGLETKKVSKFLTGLSDTKFKF